MQTIIEEMSPETYVLCEKAAKAAGKETAEEWVEILIANQVGHTSLARIG